MSAYEISCDKSRLDIDAMHSFLTQSYWSPGIGRDIIERAIAHSLCFGLFHGSEQVGFARVITDTATFAYLADVYVLPGHRGQGLALRLMQEVTRHPDLQGLRRMLLATLDAHGLYEKFGFRPLSHPERMMEIHNPGIYQARQSGRSS